MSDHNWFRENLDLYGAGALAADERLRLERHAAECAACAQELARWRLFDQGLGRLGAPVHFGAAWDERVVARWRVKNKPPRRWSAPARWAAAAAAVLFVGLLGACFNAVAQLGFIAFPGGEVVQGDRNLPTVLPVFSMVADGGGDTMPAGAYHKPAQGRTTSSNDLKQLSMNWYDDYSDAGGWAFRGHGSATELFGAKLSKDSKKLSLEDEKTGVNALVSGLTPSGTKTPDLNAATNYSPVGFGTRIDGTAQKLSAGEQVPDGGVVLNGALAERMDGLQKLQGGDIKYGMTFGIELSDGSVRREWSSFAGTGIANSDNGRDKAKFDVGSKGATDELRDLAVLVKESNTGSLLHEPGFPAGGSTSEKSPAKVGQVFVVEDKAEAKLKDEKALRGMGMGRETTAGKTVKATVKSSAEYYSLPGLQQNAKQDARPAAAAGSTAAGGLPASAPTLPAEGARSGLKKEEGAGLKNLSRDQGPLVDLQNPISIQQPKPAPEVAQRKIIRTGDMEFEVDSFDNTVNQVTKLINAIPGAFVATVNSDKLPNGKMKGSVVVRVPPEHLDKFVFDLRQTLAKTGELKSQRIGSADVTKQYTDIESRLRAARTMEERFINIIKTGKGEVKDLIAAERELGIWRTKIEEMEGEIRFYNNQVGLSTLTITAFEKEIRAAASMVSTEHVKMAIECDDVEKSLQAALTAVTEAKGRVTKSDLTQKVAAQLEATLLFEVAPAAAPAVKDKLKTLGIVTQHDVQRKQQAEGGSDPGTGEIKSRTSDVRFEVTLYNVANVKARQTFEMTIAVLDVAPEYQRLLDLAIASKAQIRVSQLDEKDKTNVVGDLEFEAPSDKRELFDKQLAALGDVVDRKTTRAGPTETATDRKVGYRLKLKSVMSIPPRETLVLAGYSLDVPAAYQAIQRAARDAKGHIRVTQLDEKDKGNTVMQLEFDVPTGSQAAIDKLLEEVADVASRTTSRVAPSEVASERKVGYKLTLQSRIPPREIVELNLEVNKDVDSAASKLTAMVREAKGKVVDSTTTEDASGRAIAGLLYEIPLAAKYELVSKFKLVGTIRGQKALQNLQAPDSKLAKAQVVVRLTNVDPIVRSDEGLLTQIRTSLGYAVRFLSVSLMFVIVGVSVLLPWLLVVWVGIKIVRRMRGKAQAAA